MNWVDDVESLAIYCDDDLAILIDDKTCKTFSRSLNLASEEGTAIVRKRPTEFKIFTNKSFGGSVAGDGLELFY